MFAGRDRALRTVLQFSQTHSPRHLTKRYKYHQNAILPKTRAATDVRVLNADAIDVALGMRDPLVLVLADDLTPGGCVLAGAGMQEESLFRRTALFVFLKPDMYPLAPDEALYARHVPVLLTNELSGYQPQTGRPCVSFIACPGLKMPQLNGDQLSVADTEVLRRKVRLILQVAADNGHTEVVLGALGCGVWGCPPRHVAQIFKEVLEEADSAMHKVHFAILGAMVDLFKQQLK